MKLAGFNRSSVQTRCSTGEVQSLAIWLVFLSAMDCLVTWIAFRFYPEGSFIEFNPVYRLTDSWAVTVLVYWSVRVLLFIGLYRVGLLRYLWLMAGIMVAVVFSNVIAMEAAGV